MTARRVLVLCLLVTLLTSSANGLCNIIDPVLCGLLPLCSITSLLGLCASGDSLLNIQITTGSIAINLDTNLLGLSITAGSSSHVSVNLGGVISIATDLNITGPSVVSVNAGATITVGGGVRVSPSSILDVAGTLNIGGNSVINGNLHLAGAFSNSASQTAWITSSKTVTLSGTSGAPATITGNGGLNADVVATGSVTAGEPLVVSSLYFKKSFILSTASTFRVYGNATVEGDSNVNGRLHLGGPRTSGKNQTVWFNSLTPLYVSGTPTSPAKLTGNGGISGDVILGDYAGVSAGNSPGIMRYAGNLQMSSFSFMEIEVEGPAGNQFDQYLVDKNLYRNGILHILFTTSYLPSPNDRFNFATHLNCTGTFNTVYTNTNEVLAAYSNRSTAFIYMDPTSPSVCSCVSVE